MADDLKHLPPDHPTVNPELHLKVLDALAAAGRERQANFDPRAEDPRVGARKLAEARRRVIEDHLISEIRRKAESNDAN